MSEILTISKRVDELFPYANFGIEGMKLREVDCLSRRGGGQRCKKEADIRVMAGELVLARRSDGCENCQWRGEG